MLGLAVQRVCSRSASPRPRPFGQAVAQMSARKLATRPRRGKVESSSLPRPNVRQVCSGIGLHQPT
eukprot:1393538-Alexandrium_andersonii.AAC.1